MPWWMNIAIGVLVATFIAGVAALLKALLGLKRRKVDSKTAGRIQAALLVAGFAWPIGFVSLGILLGGGDQEMSWGMIALMLGPGLVAFAAAGAVGADAGEQVPTVEAEPVPPPAAPSGPEHPTAPSGSEESLRDQITRLKDSFQEPPYSAADLYNLGRLYALLFDLTSQQVHRSSALKYMRAAAEADPDIFAPLHDGRELSPFGSLGTDPDFREFTK